jgi:signal peptidase I
MGLPPSSNGTPSGRTYHRLRARRKTLVALAIVAGTGYALLRWRPFRVEIAGGSMRPALEPGEWALAVALVRVRRGGVVVLEHPGRPGFEVVKRIVAIPGDLAPDGRVLEGDEYWVEGDASEASTDSRAFGPVARSSLRGAVRLVYWPPERWRLL